MCVYVCMFIGVDIMTHAMWRPGVNLEVIPQVTPHLAFKTSSVTDLERDDTAKPADAGPQESGCLHLPGSGVISTCRLT